MAWFLLPDTLLVFGLVVGVFFGFFLSKAGVNRRSVILGQLLLKDFTVMKVILSAILTGSLILFSYKAFTAHEGFIISKTTLKAAFSGGLIFGVGMAMLGFCPGTCIAALAQKERHALWGALGMVAGAAIYAEVAHGIKKSEDLINQTTLADYFSISPWYCILCVAILVALMKFFIKK